VQKLSVSVQLESTVMGAAVGVNKTGEREA